MAFEYPEDLKYLDTHEYARVDDEENIVTVGITAFAPLIVYRHFESMVKCQ